MKEMLDFLRLLEQNNNREWFNAHKPDYLHAREQFEQLAGRVIAGLGQVDPSVKGLKPSDTIYRIYRDTRFALDKTPYKNNLGSHFSRGGKSTGNEGYYINIQPGNCFISGGIYMPAPEKLKAIRKEIYLFPEDFRGLIEAPEFVQNFIFFQDDKLKRPPVGYPSDFPLIEYLKYKHFCPWIPMPDEWLDDPDLADRIVKIFILMKPFNDFIHRAIEDL